MTRDEMLLTGLAEGVGSTVDLMVSTGLPERTVRRGLHRLIGSGRVFSPLRGSYRLTSVGSGVVEELSSSDPAPRIEQSREPHYEPDAVPPSTATPWWVWVGAGALAAAAVMAARQEPKASEPPPPAAGPLRVRPSAWRSAY